MWTYSGRLWLARDQGEKIHVEILLEEEAIRINSDGTLIGDWPMTAVRISRVGNNLHLFVEGEQLVISPTDHGLVPALLHREPESREFPPDEPSIDSSSSEEPATAETESDDRPTKSRRRKGAHRAKGRMRWTW